jgi:hypothetical protein
MESAKALRRKAESLVAQGRYADAALAYRAEAAIYRRNGDTEGAKVEETKADRWTSSIRLYAELPGYRPAPLRLGKFEPAYGCYIGAFLDRDERLGSGFVAGDQLHRDPEPFGRLTGKKLSSTFCYVAYGRPFPREWVARLRDQDVAPHIAWEPNQGLNAVQNDDYLATFAREAGAAGCPIFLRYASEMNGDWTAYGGNPLLYKTKWGLVRDVFARYAPNVAMVWCVNNNPERTMQAFYPGDAYVDWVGVNLYSVPFYDNDPSRPGLNANPADLVRYVYGLYAARKPIMICEFGASHVSKVDHRDRSGWAAARIAELYAALPRIFPRVKLIDIFDNDNLRYADDASRQLNNYSVTDSQVVLDAYARAVAPDYYLSTIGQATRAIPVAPLDPALSVSRGILRVSSWARCYAESFAVTYALDGRDVATVREPGPREARIELASRGVRRLSATVTDDRGRIAARTEVKITVS